MSTIIYCFRQAFSNLRKNLLFSAASAVTIAACIFLFCIFYSIVMNVQHITYTAETTIGISVFFNNGVTKEEKDSFAEEIKKHGGVREISYKSADEAWKSFKEDYFGDQSEELAEAFADDNPLAESDSYEIFLNNIEDQEAEVQFIKGFDIVREVNYANQVVSTLKSLNRVMYLLSVLLIGILFAISIFLISNTINLAAHFRKRENQIMRMIGATDGMIRAPFVIEGTLIGFMGAALPLLAMYFIYSRAELTVAAYLGENGRLSSFSDLVELIPLMDIYPKLLMAGLALGVGMGFIVSFITIRKHLKV